jgi:hypothetical protein
MNKEKLSGDPKTQLTGYEIPMAWIANRHHNVDQHVIAKMYDVNAGRVAEAIVAMDFVIAHLDEVYKLAKEAKQNGT